MKVEPMITVRDVPASSRFYQQVLDAKSGHGGDEYEQIVRDGVLLLDPGTRHGGRTDCQYFGFIGATSGRRSSGVGRIRKHKTLAS